VITPFSTLNGETQLEAFASRQNRAILDNADENLRNKSKEQLFWVSVGYPGK